MRLRRLAAAAALTLGLAGIAAPAHADFFDPPVNDPGGGAALDWTWTPSWPAPVGAAPEIAPGAGCKGSNYQYHAWNLFMPQDVVGMDSCRATVMIAARGESANLTVLLTLLATKYPQAAIPPDVAVAWWGAWTANLTLCAAPGNGVEFAIDNRDGQVMYCRSQ